MQLYRWQEKDNPYNCFQVTVKLPLFHKVYFYDNFAASYYKGINISFDTAFTFRKTKDHWFLIFSILGFGFSISRQTDY